MGLDEAHDERILYIGWTNKRVGKWRINFTSWGVVLLRPPVYRQDECYIFKFTEDRIDFVLVDILSTYNFIGTFVCNVEVKESKFKVFVISDRSFLSHEEIIHLLERDNARRSAEANE